MRAFLWFWYTRPCPWLFFIFIGVKSLDMRCSLTLSVRRQENKLSHNYLFQDSHTFFCCPAVCLVLNSVCLCVAENRRSITHTQETQREKTILLRRIQDPQYCLYLYILLYTTNTCSDALLAARALPEARVLPWRVLDIGTS